MRTIGRLLMSGKGAQMVPGGISRSVCCDCLVVQLSLAPPCCLWVLTPSLWRLTFLTGKNGLYSAYPSAPTVSRGPVNPGPPAAI